MKKRIVLILAILILLGSTSALAVPGTQVYLPMISKTTGAAAQDALALPAGYSGLVESVPLTGSRLLVLIMVGDTNLQAYVYDPFGGYTITDAWEVSGKPSRIDVRGCVWVISESTDWNFITVHRIRLPEGAGCEV